MFKEIEKDILSMISDRHVEKIAHMPTTAIARTMEILYKIKYEEIERVYIDKSNNMAKLLVIHNSSISNSITTDLCPINGCMYHITTLSSSLIDKAQENAITFCETIIRYIAIRISLIMNEYSDILNIVNDNMFHLILLQAIPVLTCSTMRKVYSNNESLIKLIHMSLNTVLTTDTCGEEGIRSILNLLDEELGVEELLDNGFICSIPEDDTNYPGIWDIKSDKSNIEKED